MYLLTTFCVVIIIQLYFYFFLFRKYTSFKPEKHKSSKEGVSVIIAAKNEAANLDYLLPKLSEQEFPSFEVILIDDASTDSTLAAMNSFKELHKDAMFDVKVIPIDSEDSNGKKAALTQGIKAAKYEHILLTDADCQANSKFWIRHMSDSFTKDISLVLGYGAYEKRKNSFLNKLIRFETMLTALQYFSYAIDGKAYMGVGRNLAYKKSIFLSADGFEKHKHVRSGDDDLFISQVANSENISICDHQDSFTVSKSHVKFSAWIRQKRRHISTASHYKKTTKFMLSMFYLSQFSFYVLILLALITKTHLTYVIPLIAIRFFVWYVTINRTTNRLDEKDLTAFGPLYEISIIFIQLYLFFKNIISPPKYW